MGSGLNIIPGACSRIRRTFAASARIENGIETPRARVTLATGIPPEMCRRINLGYRDPKSIRQEDFANRENEGVLLVPKAGEMLFQLAQSASLGGRNS